MAYCTVNDVNNYAANLNITGTTDPTSAAVSGMITSVSAEMDQQFKVVGVTTPVTDSDVLEMLKPVCAFGTIARIYRSLNLDEEMIDGAKDEYSTLMKELIKNPSLLGTATEDGPIPGGTTREEDDRVFQRTEKQW